MIYFGYLVAIILSAYVGCRFCPYRDDAMIKESLKCQTQIKELNKKHDRLSADYAEALAEISRLYNKLAAGSLKPKEKS